MFSRDRGEYLKRKRNDGRERPGTRWTKVADGPSVRRFITLLLMFVAVGAWAQQESSAKSASHAAAKSSAAHSSTPLNPLFIKAQGLVRQHHWEEAETVVHQFLQAEPTSGHGHALLGFILFQRNQPAESLQEFSRAVASQPPSALDLKIVGLDYAMQQDYKNAEKWLAQSLAMDLSDSQTCARLGEVKYTEQHYQEAIDVFNRCLQLDPRDSFSATAVGASYEALNRTDDAVAAYKLAIQSQRHTTHQDPTPLYDLGTLLVKQKRTEEAVPYLRQGVALAPGNANLHGKLGEAYAALNKLPEARNELQQAVALSPNLAQLHFILGQVYRRLGQIDNAETELQKYQALGQENTGASHPEP